MDNELLSNVSPEAILHWTYQLSRSRRRLDEANGAHRALVKQAKRDGMPTLAILESISLARLDPHERRQRIIDRIRVEAARNIDDGAALLDEVSRLDRRVSSKARAEAGMFHAEQEGYHAGLHGIPAEDCPYDAGSEAGATWRQYWHDGQAQAVLRMGDHGTMASTEKRRRGNTDKPRRRRQNKLALVAE